MLQTLTVPEPCVALHCSVSTWSSAPYTELPPALLDGKTHHWCQLWKSFRFLANRSCKTNKHFAKWGVTTTGPFQHSSYCSLEKDMLSLTLAASHSCQNLCISWDPFGDETEYYWEGSLNYTMILKEINYFKAFKEGWREGKSGSLQSFGEIWGIWLKDLDSLQYRCLLGCSMECWQH